MLLLGVLIAFACAQYTSEPGTVDSYMFAQFNQTNPIAMRSGAVIGSAINLSVVYVLSGAAEDGTAEPDSYKFDIPTLTWTKLATTLTRTKACSSQDSARALIWIFGGISSGTFTAPFLQFNLDTSTVTNLTAPPANTLLEDASCLASADGSKFYAMFGETTPSDLEKLAEVNCTETAPNVEIYESAKWSTVITTGDVPPSRVGASANFYGNTIVVFGGVCGDEGSNDVYRLDTTSNIWMKDVATGTKPSARGYTSSFIIQDTLFVYGGRSSAAQGPALSDAFVYDLKAKNWSAVSTSTMPEARSDASTVLLLNRAFVFGGLNAGAALDDALQLVVQNACLSLGCEDCTYANPGCGWCAPSSKCIAGDTSAYISATCNSTTVVSDLDSCPQIFPSYGIALLVIGGVVVIGIIIFAIMKVRSGDDKDGYERIS